MNKRVISLILIAVTVFGLCSAVFAESVSFADKVIRMLLGYSADERKDYLYIIEPMLTTDFGIDSIISMLNNYNPNSEDIANVIAGLILEHTDKKTAISAVSSLKIIDSDIRLEYASAFRNRETLRLSNEATEDIKYFVTKAYKKHNGLEQLMNDDGINEGVIAKMLTLLVSINDNKPLFTDSSLNKENFEIYSVSAQLKTNIKKYLSDNGLGSYDSLLNKYLNLLNVTLTDDEKQRVKRIGKEVGFYTEAKKSVSSNGGIGYQKDSKEIRYNVITDKSIIDNVDFMGSTLVEVGLYINGIKQEFGSLDKDYTITLPVTSDNVMAYKVEDSLIPIRYSAYSENNLYIRINSTGYYCIKQMPKHFTDSNDWGSAYIESLYNRGIINGTTDDCFAPDINITREEFVKLVVALFDYNDDKYYVNFSDVSSDDWFYKYVAIAYKYGIISGVGNNRFGTGDYITRQDICKIISNIIKQKNISLPLETEERLFIDSNEISDYAKDSVSLMSKAGIIVGDQNSLFHPKSFATRQETAKIIHGILELYVKETLK